MSLGAGIRIAVTVFVVAILQVSAFSAVGIGGGGPDVLLVTLVSIALLRGAITGAIVGFAAGLIVDVATLGTLGLTSLLLTLAGYWAGRYGETTGRGRAHAPLVATVAATVFMELGGYGARIRCWASPSRRARFSSRCRPAILWNALLAYPVFGLVRRLVGTTSA